MPTTILVITDFDAMGLKNIFRPFAQDVMAFAGYYGAADTVDVRRIAATAAQVERYVPANLRLAPPSGVAWWRWPFQLPAAEALADQLPDIVRDHLDELLPDAELRAEIVARESGKRVDAAVELRRLLAS